METPLITIDMRVKCKECGQKGATENGLCLKCITTTLIPKLLAGLTDLGLRPEKHCQCQSCQNKGDSDTRPKSG